MLETRLGTLGDFSQPLLSPTWDGEGEEGVCLSTGLAAVLWHLSQQVALGGAFFFFFNDLKGKKKIFFVCAFFFFSCFIET